MYPGTCNTSSKINAPARSLNDRADTIKYEKVEVTILAWEILCKEGISSQENFHKIVHLMYDLNEKGKSSVHLR